MKEIQLPTATYTLTDGNTASTAYIRRKILFDMFSEGKNIFTHSCSLKLPSSEKSVRVEHMYNFIRSFSDNPPRVFEESAKLLLVFDDILVHFADNGWSLSALISGEQEAVENFQPIIYEHFEKYTEENQSFIKWCFVDDAGKLVQTSMPLRVNNPPFTEMYPFLESETLEEYYERFISSSASILLLQGPPGTGKTTFIRGLLQHTNANALLSYDDAVLKSDVFLNSFIRESEVKYLVFEDADAYLTSRESGNRTIHKFLNAGDGLISSSDKKIIFTTNLANLSDIDQALIRPGRCFDILQFRPLTKAEAITVAQKQGVEVELPEQNFTIAEIFNSQKYTKKKESRSIGFAL